MRYFAPFLLLLISIMSFGQNEIKIDSLKTALSKSVDEKTKSDLLTTIFNSYVFINLDSAEIYKNRIAQQPNKTEKELINSFSISSKYHFYKSQLDSALYFTEEALGIAIKLNDDNLKSDLYRKMAILSSRNFNYEDAEKYGKLALEAAIETKDWYLIASSNIMLGNQYYKKTQFDLALKCYLNADSLYSSNNEEDRYLANSYDNISSIYIDLKDERALLYIEKSNKIYQLLNDKEGLAYNSLLSGMYYSMLNEHQQAIPNFEEAIVFYKDYGDVFRLNEAQTRLIKSYAAIGNYKKAEAILLEAENGLKNVVEKGSFFSFYLNAGQLYLNLKKYDLAIDYFNKAYDIVDKSEDNFSISYSKNVKKGLKNAYTGKKDYKNALKFSQLLLEVTDSIYKKNNLDITKELETKYETEKKEQEITLLKSQNELVQQQKKNQRNQLLGGISITSIAGIFFFFLYRNRQKTTKKLQELDKAKSIFFTNISHEFRTPLTMISGPLQSQLQKKNLTEEDRSNFEMMHRNSNRLLSLVDQLLDISKIESGNVKLKVAKNSAIPFIGTLADGFTFKALQQKINYKVSNTPTVIDTYFDADILEKIVVNLLSNAMKYTPENGSIVCNSAVEKNNLHLTVKNTGDGLSEEEITSIFERFYQVNEDQQGVGIGLALVKELVALHKGSIKVESIPNDWTTFTVVLPITKEHFKENEIINAATIDIANSKPVDNNLVVQENKNLNIEIDNDESNEDKPILLITDDNADVRTYLGNVFKEKYTILLAKDGQEGIDIAIEHIPDIIISDIMMPVKSGIELCNTLKVDERTSHIPIILLTAKAGEEHEIEGIQTGADDYVTKPFNEELLKIRIEKLIESRKILQLRYSQEVILKPKDISISSVDEQFLERLQKVLDDKLVESTFSIEELSKDVGMSRMQLHRKLKALTGLSASQFIRSQRLKLATQLLKKSDINVSEVGYSVGFNNHAYFSKCFKDMYNCTPTEYMKSSQSND